MFWDMLNRLRKTRRGRLASRAPGFRKFRPYLKVLEDRTLLSGGGPGIPSITSISPRSGPQSGGTQVTISGNNLSQATAVDFGSVLASSFSYNSSNNTITAVSPAESPNMVDIRVFAGQVESQPTASDQFTFTAINGSTTALSSSANPAALGQAVTFTATITGLGAGTPTGTVTFEDGSTVLGTSTLTSNGSANQAVYTTSALAAGPHSITAVYSGDSSFSGSSASLTQTVEQISPTDAFTVLTSSAQPAAPGEAVTFTATVSSTGGMPTGTVTFKDGSSVLGTATLSAGISAATASFTTSSLALGLHAIVADYSGDVVFIASSSATLTEAVQKLDTTTSLTASTSVSEPSQAVTFTASVSSAGGGTPTGTVTFMDGTTVLGSGTLAAATVGAQTSFTTSSLALGLHTITAVYSGDSTFLSTTSASTNEVVAPESTAMALVTSADPAPTGQAVTFTATLLADRGGTPTGTVTFMNGSTVLGTAPLSAASFGAQATFTTSTLPSGCTSITAVYGGASIFGGSSVSLSQIVGQNSTSISTTSLFSSGDSLEPGEAVVLTALVHAAGGGTPTGTVTFLDGSTVLGTGTLSAATDGAQATFTVSSLALGYHTITASYGGDSNDAGSTSASITEAVETESSFISLASSAGPAAPGQAITWTATVSGADGGAPTGTVTFLDGSTVLGTGTLSATSAGMQATFTLASLANGTHAITAEYGGDTTYASSSSASSNEVVQLVVTSTAVSASVDPALVGQAVTLTATVNAANGGTPTGTITFMDGTTALGTAALSAAAGGAQATLTTSSLAAARHSITAVYNGDSTCTGSTSASSDEMVEQIVSYTGLASSNAAVSTGQSVTFTATVVGQTGGTPTGTVTFQDGSTVLATVNLSPVTGGAQATYSTSSLSSGIHVVTAMYSGDNAYLSSSATFAQNVGQTTTTSSAIALISSTNPALPGQTVTFTASVGSTGTGTPTGTVLFLDGSTLVGCATLTAASTGALATFTTSILALGNHSITAVYGGDATFAGSASTTVSQAVQQLSTSISLSSSASQAVPGQAVAFTVTVTRPDGGTPTGTVTWKDGSTVLGSSSLTATATGALGVFTTAALAAGTHTITAVYGGDSQCLGSTSAALSETVQQQASHTALSASADQTDVGEALTLTATVVGLNGGAPTGTVTFMDDNTALGSVTLSAATFGAQATFTTSSLTPGTHALTAVYNGDSGYTGSTTSALNESVQLLQSLASVSTSADFPTPGDAVTFTATVVGIGTAADTPTGNVTFLDGTTILGTASLVADTGGMPGSQATLTTSTLTEGWHAITVVYGGDASFSGASGSLAEVIGQSTAASSSTTLDASASTVAPGTAVTFTATVTGIEGTPTGSVTFLDGATSLGTVALSIPAGTTDPQASFTTSALLDGTHTITAIYGGDTSYAASASASANATVGTTLSTTTLITSANGLLAGEAMTLTATVAGTDGGTPTGTVTFMDGSTVLGTATLTADVVGAEASLTTTALTTGHHFITVVYGGDSTYASSSSDSESEIVQQASSWISLSPASNPATPGQGVTLTATVSGVDDGTPTGTVTFMDGSTVLGTATLSAASLGAQAVVTASGLATGTHSLTAVYNGDSAYAASTSASLSEQIQLLSSQTYLASSANSVTPGQSVTFTATVVVPNGGTPTGTVTFKDGTTVLATVTVTSGASGFQATYSTSTLTTGSHALSAIYNGDSTYASGSASLTQGISVSAGLSTYISMTCWPSTQVVGQPVTFVAHVGSSSGSGPTGMLLFEEGGKVLGAIAVGASGSSNEPTSFVTSALPIGSHSITAVYAGDGTYANSSGAGPGVTVVLVSSSTTVSASTGSAAPGDPITFTATVTGNDNGTPTGTVTFEDGSTVLGTAALSPSDLGAEATYTISTLTAGTHTITAVYGGSSVYAGSTSAGLSEPVQQDVPMVFLSASTDPLLPGEAVTLTADISSVDGNTDGSPTGLVTFEEGTAVLGTATLTATTSGAEATLTLPGLPGGIHHIVAVYSGDAAFTAGTSPMLQASVQQDQSATSLSASTDFPAAGQAVTLTAAVIGMYTTGTPTGTVTFLDGSTVLGTTTLSPTASGAQATCTVVLSGSAVHSITATYNGDTLFASSTSASLIGSVGFQGTTVLLTTSSATIATGQAVSFTATVNGADGGTPTGTVAFLDGSTILGTVALSAGAAGMQAIFTTSSLAAGAHAVAAVYEGDSNYLGSSDSLPQIVGSSTATASSIALSSSASVAGPGQAVTLTATVTGASSGTPSGTVTFLDGSTVLGTATLGTGGQATLVTSTLPLGFHPLTAIYGGSSSFAPSTSTTMTQLVQLTGSSISLSSSADPATLGQALTLTALVSGVDGGSPTGTVTFLDGTTILGTGTLSTTSSGTQATLAVSSLGAGNHSLSAVYGGSSTYTGSSSASLSQPVQLFATSATVTATTNTPALGQAVTFTATVSGANGGTPTGTVLFLDGTVVLGTASLSAVSGGAQASLTLSSLATGTHFLAAVYSGDSTFSGTTSNMLNTTVQQVFSYTAVSSSNPSASVGQPITFTATVLSAATGIPTGTVTFEDGSTVLATVTLSAGSSGAQATYTTTSLAYGSHVISAVYNGDSTFVGGSASMLQTIGTSLSTGDAITVASSATSAVPGQSVTFTATVTSTASGTPTGTVTFLDGSTVLGTATLSAVGSGAQATFTTVNLALGSHSITASYGGDSNFPRNTSTVLSQTVQQKTTSVALGSSATTAAVGQAVTFTATIGAADGGWPTGTVTFKDGSTVLGTAPLQATLAGVQAVFTIASLAGGTHTITGVYGGDGCYLDSTSTSLTETVQSVSTTTTLLGSDILIRPGASLTFTALVIGTSGSTPTGTITFMDGSTVLGSASLTPAASGAQAAFTVSSLANGVHSITAVYSGDTGNNGNTSAPLAETVQQFQSTATLSSSADSLFAGQSVTFTATVVGVAAGVALPTGMVTFMDGSSVLGSAPLSGTLAGMQATLTTTALTIGTHTITAVYGGDGAFAGNTSGAVAQTVVVNSTTTALSSSAVAAAPGVAVTLTATVRAADDGTPTGTVTFMDGSTVLGTVTLSAAASGAQATFTTSTLTVGMHSLSAVYNGDADDNGSTSVTLGERIAQASSFATLASSANPATAGQAVTFTATISGTAGLAPTGTVTFEDAGVVLGTGTLTAVASSLPNLWSAQASFTTSSLTAGSHAITAVYGGSSAYTGSNAALSENVSTNAGSPSTTALTSTATAALPGQAVTFTATLTWTGTGTPTGTVTFSDGSTVLATVALSGTQASFTTSTLTNGTHAITASYSGDGTFATSTSAAVLQSIQPASSTITTLESSATTSDPGQAVTLTATVTSVSGGAPAGTVTFEDGTLVLGTATLSPGLEDMPGQYSAQATFTTAGLTLGAHALTAVYGGANVFTASTSTALTETVQLQNVDIALDTSAVATTVGQSVTFTATVTATESGLPTGMITFEDGTTVLGMGILLVNAAGAEASFTTSALAVGDHTITAVYSGDNAFSSGTSAALTQTVALNSTTTTLISSAPAASPGQTVTLTATVTVSSTALPTGTVTFLDGTTVLGTVSLVATATGAQATFTTSTLAGGAHALTASYSGDTIFAGSTSANVTQTVTTGSTEDSATNLASSDLQADPNQVVTFTATVTGADGGTPTGTVTFEDGSTVLGSAILSAGASGTTAILSTSALATGTHTITAVYSGDSNYAGSTSTAVSVTIQAGASVGSGDTSSLAGTGSSLVGDTSADGTTLGELFNGQVASAAGIPTPQGPSNAASSNPDLSGPPSGNTAATPPQGPTDSSSTGLSVSGTYEQDYTEWGNNANGAYYAHVVSTNNFGPSGQTGTITYTAWLEMDGIMEVDDQDVVEPFSYGGSLPFGITSGSLPPGGVLSGYNTEAFGFDGYTWDEEHYEENTTLDTSGAFTAANGQSYQTAQHSSISSWWDSTRDFTDDGSGTESGIAIYTIEGGNTWSNDVTATDVAANFSTSTPLNAQGYPTSLFAAPAAGTTYLTRSFDSGSGGGVQVNTFTVAHDANTALANAEWDTSYDGVSGDRYFYSHTDTVTSGGNSDTVTWNINQQDTNQYGGSDHGDFSYDSNQKPSGSSTTKTNNDGQASATSTMKDQFQRTSASGTTTGTYQWTSSSPNQTSHSVTTEAVTMAAGASTADTLHYDQSTSGGLSLTASNSDSYTLTDSPDGNTVRGTMAGSDFSLSINSVQVKNTAVGTTNLLSGIDSSTVTTTTKGSSFSLESWTATYTPSDGLNTYKMTSRLVMAGSNSDSTTAAGTFNSSGTQRGGSLSDTNGDDGILLSSLTATDQPTNELTTTYTQVVGGTYHDDATANMSVNSDGSLSGPLKMHSRSVTTTDTTTKLEGTELLEQGLAFTDDRMHSHDVLRGDLVADLRVSAGQVCGTSTNGSHDTNNWDYDMLASVDLNDDVLHSVMTGGGSGDTHTDDTTTTTFANGASSATRTVTFAQHGKTGAITVSWGDLSDAEGHTGGWDLTSTTSGKVNDTVTITTSQNGTRSWIETGRHFAIDESSKSDSTYHEEDDGLNTAAASNDPSIYGTYDHTVDTTTSANQSNKQDGTPTNYTFTTHQRKSQQRIEQRKNEGGNRATGDGWSGESYKKSNTSSGQDRTGAEAGGLRTLSQLLEFTLVINRGWSKHTQWSPTYRTGGHTRYENTYSKYRGGSVGPGGSGTGTEKSHKESAQWGSEVSNGVTHNFGDVNGTVVDAPVKDLSWGANFQGTTLMTVVAEDFSRDPLVHWVGVHGSQLLQIGGGVVDVIAGLGMMFGSCGGAVIPAVGLMAVGIDQILTGASNMANPGSPSMSVFQYLGYSGAMAAGLGEQASQTIGEYTPMALEMLFGAWGSLAGCFAAGTPLLTPDGDKPIEQFRPGDWLLSAPENDPEAAPRPRRVEEVFEHYAQLLHVHVQGSTIRTTSEHPFYVRGKGWKAAKELAVGDRLRSHDGRLVAVDSVTAGEGFAAVYNVRVTEHHTYFVGTRAWGFSVWAHNACHGNALASKKVTTLYELVDSGGNRLKWGISSNPLRRYSDTFLRKIGAVLKPVMTGSRSRMAQIERSLVSQLPGSMNFEPWAGSMFPR